MPSDNKTYTTYLNGWVLRIRPPVRPAEARLLLMIHGWTGDENSMWVFARDIPDGYAILAPRGPVKAPQGYGWVDISDGDPAGEFEAYAAAGEQLLNEVQQWCAYLQIPSSSRLDLMGFSQGAALAYAMAIHSPHRVRKIAGLSGFLPAGARQAIRPGSLAGVQIFVAHGARDEIIPVQQAQEALKVLSQAGADVSYCEEEVGHKLGTACYTGLRGFFAWPV